MRNSAIVSAARSTIGGFGGRPKRTGPTAPDSLTAGIAPDDAGRADCADITHTEPRDTDLSRSIAMAA
ncbi:hypothetical protein [Maliponia aquimaris]|uniref:Uncharacterized protein n=1 Tax=Maliponia aquimaris TaxID=1673631 RepID=A0A238JQT6_9RHOB|nr:hypothetical protein [Maliponia aquimaris]SMX33048.1 hypothetical protein MAA8898_00385 [Maliponia aquimaris]